VKGTRPSSALQARGARRGSRGSGREEEQGHVGCTKGCEPAVWRRKSVGPKEAVLFLN
jgi:hypothetical protein